MKYTQNLHTHSVFCDGKNHTEELVAEAIKQGLDTIGFSSHSTMAFAPNETWQLSPERRYDYIATVNTLKKKYADKITVLLGIEQEMYSGTDTKDFDYVIGSSHYFKIGNEYVKFDSKSHILEDLCKTYFGGNGLKMAEEYYKAFSELKKYGSFDIVGHFDIISKHVETTDLFDINDKKYQGYALDCLHTLAKDFDVFEVNTGCIARGYKSFPYPAPFVMKELNRLNKSVIITSDCHRKELMTKDHDFAYEYIKEAGFKSIAYIEKGKFIEKSIK